VAARLERIVRGLGMTVPSRVAMMVAHVACVMSSYELRYIFLCRLQSPARWSEAAGR
jgi:hypothetical protein